MARINDNRYKASHNKSPRGDGSWLFEDKKFQIKFHAFGTFGQAKKEAIRWCKENNCFELWVCP